MIRISINPFRLRRRSLFFPLLIVSVFLCLCGAISIMFAAPAQFVRALRVSTWPAMDAAAINAAAPGDMVLFTGVLADNPPLVEDLVVCTAQEWRVTLAEDNRDTQPRGKWVTIETDAPALTIEVSGEAIVARPVPGGVALNGALRQTMVQSAATLRARDNDDLLWPDGARRYRGLSNGDLVTVLGNRATGGGVIPEQIFGGDRPAFEQSQRDAVGGLLLAGLCSIGLAVLALSGGLWSAVFRR